VDGSWTDIPLSIGLNAKLFIDYRKLSETAGTLPGIPAQDVRCHNLAYHTGFECEVTTSRPCSILHRLGQLNLISSRNQVKLDPLNDASAPKVPYIQD